jgi:hypothetical protein
MKRLCRLVRYKDEKGYLYGTEKRGLFFWKKHVSCGGFLFLYRDEAEAKRHGIDFAYGADWIKITLADMKVVDKKPKGRTILL